MGASKALPKILIIEDDDDTASEMERTLRERGFAVDRAADGTEGLKAAASGRYDVITLDRMLQGVDGLSLASALRGKGIKTPILMISALSDVDERIRGLRAGGGRLSDQTLRPWGDAGAGRSAVSAGRRRCSEADLAVCRP